MRELVFTNISGFRKIVVNSSEKEGFMTTQQHREKVKLTVECTSDERAYIKMLAAKAHMTISEFVLNYIRRDLPSIPNKETLEAMREIDEGRGIHCESLDDFWEQMGIKPNAKT
jgi:hypothetical protein